MSGDSQLKPTKLEPISIDSVLSSDDVQQPKIFNLNEQQFYLNKTIAIIIMLLFGIALVSTIGMVLWLASVDVDLIKTKIIEPDERLVDNATIMAVIAATIAQVGAAAYLIVRSNFKAPADSPANAKELE